ncbi:uncharacterized protein N7443_007110 [Penicillium atrosanguineum]|uniref:uncharacterized protein n=1 Tax=Penicillium atrosanguineum TaxID=1132637 RepID=UPI00238E6FEC|nr:uncharacterized protein N7443_007110 [Penicillium atrosanguineum]KAJ5296217.1 hypothetical protein N7443_007110 [Penicillium atrosanguineum]
MVKVGSFSAAVLALGVISPSIASYNGSHVIYVPTVETWDNGMGSLTTYFHSVNSDYAHLYEHNYLDKRDTVEVYTSVVVAGTSVILAAYAGLEIYEYVAEVIKQRSNADVCSLTYGDYTDGERIEGYAYRATTTGTNCQTTALESAIYAALRRCANKLHKGGATTGCCKFRHGGSWTGHLRLSAEPKKHPASDITCPS